MGGKALDCQRLEQAWGIGAAGISDQKLAFPKKTDEPLAKLPVTAS
jgi:hypothetical protein